MAQLGDFGVQLVQVPVAFVEVSIKRLINGEFLQDSKFDDFLLQRVICWQLSCKYLFAPLFLGHEVLVIPVSTL